jgi:hypothetical protein
MDRRLGEPQGHLVMRRKVLVPAWNQTLVIQHVASHFTVCCSMGIENIIVLKVHDNGRNHGVRMFSGQCPLSEMMSTTF